MLKKWVFVSLPVKMTHFSSFFLKLAMKQPDGEYRYGVETVYKLYPLSAELNDDMKEKNATL
ncbi:hypothetical protein KY290_033341 [Solanum tuberosum]|uniref:Uncharacterized protein n=1 Tax=Solanum tuberosum TaxID=4113 RepID=A0ABQ7U1U4_SOLTU|nr:hypothetical protein KY290_033341 [Solanum tuberosum]